jgi:hypothetical protein
MSDPHIESIGNGLSRGLRISLAAGVGAFVVAVHISMYLTGHSFHTVTALQGRVAWLSFRKYLIRIRNRARTEVFLWLKHRPVVQNRVAEQCLIRKPC